MRHLTKRLSIFFTVLTVAIAVFSISFNSSSQMPKSEPINMFTPAQDSVKIDSIYVSNKDSIRLLLIDEIDSYINKHFPKSKLKGVYIADACIEYNFDPCFLLAQGVIESGLGTAGKAVRTNSPWNVGQHDGRSVAEMHRLGLSHNDPNSAIVPYITLVQDKYLGNRRTIHNLMRNYVTLSGHRYASSRTYETSLSATYNRIKSKTNIFRLFTEAVAA